MIGQTVFHYKILEKIGEGGMGVVYKAEDTKLMRLVALKFLPTALTSKPTAKERFMVEARAAAALNHPHIVTVHEINEYEQQLYIVMEYVRGETLKDKIDSGLLEIDEALELAIQTAEGLREAHEQNIVHRDIKSDNIMIDEKGQVKIMDFGLAKLKGQVQLTRKGTTLGTAPYMSPEQTQGSGVDHRTDIWSLGVVMYEMFSGQLPFKGDYPQAIYYSIMNEDPEPLSRLRTGIPAELERIINKALAKKTTKRYQQIADLLTDLRKLTGDSKTKIAPLKTKTRPEFTIKVSPTSLILGGMLLAALIIAAWFFLFKGKSPATIPITPVNEAGTRPSLAVVYFENNSGDPNLDNWRSAFSELLATDLSQSKYIRVLRSDQIYSIFKRLNLLEAKKYSTEDLKEIAKNARVNRILKGSYIKAGDNFVITAMLINADTGETISSLSVKAAGENNIFPRVDELTKEIKLKLNIPSDQIADDIDENIGQITTPSAKALMLYIEGRNYHSKGEYSKSIQVMEKAVSIDPQFAMALRSMAASYGNLGFFFKNRKYLKKAVELSHRLSDRERYLIQGDFYGQTEKTYDKAIKAFKTLLELYPWDPIGNINLGILYGNLGEWDKSIEQLEVYRKNKDQDVFAYLNLAWSYNAKRLFNKSQEILKGYLDNFPQNALIHQDLAITYIYLGKFDLALDEVDKGFSLEPTDDFFRWLKGDIFYFKGDLERTKEEYKKLLDTGGARAVYVGAIRLAAFYLLRGKIKASSIQALQGIEVIKKYGETYWEAIGRQFYAYLLFKSGNFQGVLEEFDNMLNIAAQDENRLNQGYALLGKGLTYLEMSLPEQALQAAEELKKIIENGMNKKRISLYYYLMGAIELKRNNTARAIEYFNKAIAFISKIPISYASFEPPAALIDYLARAYHRNGNLEKARETYEKIALLTYGRIEDGDIFAKSFYHLGKIYQEKGWKGKAIENYNKFIELWEACDPQFQPLVEDARKRVNRLEKEN